MKTIRKIISLIVTVCLFFVTATSVDATAASTYDNSPSSFTDFCDDYYLHHDLYNVYSKDGADISDSFYCATISLYEENNIDAIFEYSKTNVLRFQKIEHTNDTVARGSIQTVKQTETFFGFVDNDITNDYDIVYTLTGKFTYNINTGKVASYSSPSISLTHVGISNWVSGAMTKVSTSAKKTSDGYGVTFSGQFYVVTTLNIPAGTATIPASTETTGPYKASFTAYGD